MTLSQVDLNALERAIEFVRARGSPADKLQIEDKLKTEPWLEVARFAVYGAQMRALRLKLWQPAPSDIDDVDAALAAGDDGVMGHYQAAKLLQRMLCAGLSRFEPDPLAALEGKPKIAAAVGA
jgi:hypothetical protein